MVTSKIETDISCEADSHICTVCNKKLMVKAWWPGLIICLLILIPQLIVFGLDSWLNHDDKLDPPFCYSEKTVNSITKRTFFDCKF